MSTRWYYAKSGTTDRQGPVGIEQIQQLIDTGELDGADVVWRNGMPQWAPIGQMPEFRPPAAAAPPAHPSSSPRPPVPPRMPVPPQAPPAPNFPVAPRAPTAPASEASETVQAAHSVGYFIPGGDMPARARETLAPFAKPTGPVGDWPLNDGHVLQLGEAVKWRKRILAAAGLTRLFFLLSVIASVILLMAIVIGAATSRNPTRDLAAMLIPAAFVLPFTILYGFAGRAIKYCRSWGSLVMAVLTTLALLLNLGSLVLALAFSPGGISNRDAPAMIAMTSIALLIGGAITAVYWRAWSATPKYLNSPVWCQEALAVAEKAK